MSIDDHTYDLIDLYLEGKLPNDHPFVLQLKDDADLLAEVEVRKLLSESVIDYRLMEVERQMENRRQEFKAQDAKKWNWLRWALPVLAVVGIAVYFFPSRPNEEQIAAKEIPSQKPDVLSSKTELKATILPKSANSNKIKVNKVEKETEVKQPIEPEKEESKVSTLPSLIENTPSPMPEQTHTVAPIAHKEAALTPVTPCEGVRIKAFIEEIRPCTGRMEGRLTIKGAKGGKAPYQYSLDGKQFQEDNTFSGLKPNEYDIVVKDENGCETLVYGKYSLLSRSCITFAEHAFNPNLGPWPVPSHSEKSGEFTVLDLNGQIAYVKSFDKGEKFTWTGSQNGGDLLLPGTYIYTIKYSDGTTEQGKISVSY